MKQIIFNKKNYKSYKDFFTDLYRQTNGAGFIDWKQYPDLNYNAGFLDEFLWYCNTDGGYHYIFLNFDKEKINLQKSFEDYQYATILRIFDKFVNKYPNNKIEFRNEMKI